jgi:hypothetical protein
MTSPVKVNKSSGGAGNLGFFQGLENILASLKLLLFLVLSSLSRGRSDRKRVVDVVVDVSWIVDIILRKEEEEGCAGCIQALEEARQLLRNMEVTTNAHVLLVLAGEVLLIMLMLLMLLMLIVVIVKIACPQQNYGISRIRTNKMLQFFRILTDAAADQESRWFLFLKRYHFEFDIRARTLVRYLASKSSRDPV